jgi:peptidoglycan hydrolase-like protein with peptidoglycan-binding domain
LMANDDKGGAISKPQDDTGNSTLTGTPGTVVLLDVPGSKNVSQAFKDKVVKIASDLGTNPNFLMAVMSFESGATFRPSVKNMAGSGAVGLIQFMPTTATGLGTTTAKLAAMTAEAQLDFVAKYFARFKGRLNSIEDTYMAVLFPAAVSKGSTFVLFRKPSKAYTQNKGLDINGDGEITVADATDKVRKILGAAHTGTGEILSRGSEGAEVEKLQDELIDLGYFRPDQKATGIGKLGPQTETALKHFQQDNHLDPNGTYDQPSQDAIRQINEGVKRGVEGNVVRGLQDRLLSVGLVTIGDIASGQGKFGPRTEAALITFQRVHGMSPTGILNDETYKALKSSAPEATPRTLAVNSRSIETVLPIDNLVGYTTYNREQGGRDQFGRASTILTIQQLGIAWHEKHPNGPSFAVGDISRRGGGPFPPHASHGDGLNFDIRPLTNNGINEPTNIGAANYSHDITRELVLLIREKVPGVIIFFNDPRLMRDNLTRRAAGHDNHLHIRLPA